MKILALILLFSLFSTAVFADSISIHIWKGRTYTDQSGEAVWNKEVNAFVVSSELMNELIAQHPEGQFYANSLSFFGKFASFFRYHYKLVSIEEAKEHADKGLAFQGLDVAQALMEVEEKTLVCKQEEIQERGPNGEFIFHANENLGIGRYYRTFIDGESVVIDANTGLPAKKL